MKLLDHGSLELIETWGSDERVIESARMSTQKGFQGWAQRCQRCRASNTPEMLRVMPTCEDGINHIWVAGDEKLLRYLYEHQHMTPFEMAGATFEVQAPIFVFREWHRHRTQSYNEASARYLPLPDLNYIPTVERLMMTGGKGGKQASSTGATLTEAGAEVFRKQLKQAYIDDQGIYEAALRDGVPKELARLVLPVGRYSRMRASANLRNWLAFLTLRQDAAAQYEIRIYADAVAECLRSSFPRTMQLFDEKGDQTNDI